MKRYSITEVREIAAESGDNELISRFEKYIAAGYFKNAPKKVLGTFNAFLAVTGTLDKIKNFPIVASPKYDGVRGIIHPEFGLISRQSKTISNHYIRQTLENLNKAFLDGEIVTFTNGIQDSFSVINSKIASEDVITDFVFFVFDDFEYPELGYERRLAIASNKLKFVPNSVARVTPYKIISSIEEAAQVEAYYCKVSEGTIFRNPKAPYKFGKSTLREGGLIKVKRFLDDEGIIVACLQLADDSYGLGSFVVKWKGRIFNLGNGWTKAQGKELWRIRHELTGKKVTFSYQEIGSGGLPRFSSFKGIRYND